MAPVLSVVSDDAAPTAAPDDALTPEGILRALAGALTDPFASGKRPAQIRSAGTALQAALGKVRAARAHLALMEAAAEAEAERALGVLTAS